MDERFRGSVSHAYQAFHGELLRFLRKHLGSSADAADLAQDTFAQWLKWPGRQSVEQPRAFFQIARNLLRDHWRRQQSRGQDLDRPAANDEPAALEGEAAGPGERFEQQQRLSHLAAALAELPPRRREAFVLHKFDGLSQVEVAERMGISLSMVEKHIASALLHCKRRLGQEAKDEAAGTTGTAVRRRNRRGHRSPRRLLVQPASFRAFQRCLPGRAGGLATRRSAPSRSARGHGAALARVRRPAAPGAGRYSRAGAGLAPARALAAAFFVFCALLVATLFWRDQSLGPNLAYGTAPGEQREVVLADGSKLFLDVDTQVQVRYAERTRDVLLEKGEVFFVVSHDPARPFRVGSGDSRVTVLGTQFSVRRNAQALAVAVKQGRVALQPSLEKDAEHVLLAGDSARLDLAEQRLELGHVAPEQVASWRDGQLVFRDKPLGELVEELSRYRAAPIRLGDPRLAGKRVSGTVRIARPDDFLLALPALLPVRVQPQAGGEVLILAR